MALIAHWPLDGRLDDVSGNGYHLTENKKLCYFESDPERGMVLRGNGTSDSLDALKLNTLDVDFKVFSICFWIKAKITGSTSGNYSEPLFGCKYGNTGLVGSGRDIYKRTLNIYRYSTETRLHTSMYRNPYGTTVVSTEINLDLTEEWVHITITDDGLVRRFYKNGLFAANVSSNGNGTFEVVKIKEPISIMVKDSKVSDYRLFNSVMSTNDINRIMKEPYIDLDFKGTIPPTVNWVDSNEKSLVYEASTNGGFVNRIDENSFNIHKKSMVQNSVYFRPMFKQFTISFKIKVIEGILKTIGGHGRSDGVNQIPKSNSYVFVDGQRYDYYWSSPSLLHKEYGVGETISISLHVNLDTNPVWDTLGIFIQPNRGLVDTPEHSNLKYKIYDIQIEEGLVATPFCTWSRDYMQIPDKSSYRDSFEYTTEANKHLPLYKPEKIQNQTIGSSGNISFTKNTESFKLKDCYINKNNTVNFVVYIDSIIGIEQWFIHQYKASDSSRFVIGLQDGVFWILIGNGNTTENIKSNLRALPNTTYLISVTISANTVKLFVDGVLLGSINNYTTTPTQQTGGIYLGNSIITTSTYTSNFSLVDFKIYPYVFTDEEVANEYKKLKNRIKSLSSAFANIPTLNVEVPRLWENNPNTIGIDCFSNNPNIPQTQAIPIGWGGEFKQPDVSILSVGTTTDMLVINPEEVIYIDPFLDSVPLHTLSIEDTQTNTESTLILTKKSKF
ncbi:MAG: LamG-like jellyroll fold domain-containing protein [Sarcina sp.]